MSTRVLPALPVPATDARQVNPRVHRSSALLGIAFVFAVIRPSDRYPSPFDDQTAIDRFFRASRKEVRALAATQTLAALAFLAFAAASTGLLQQEAGEQAAYFWVALASGTVAEAFIIVTSILIWTLSRPSSGDSLPLLGALHDLAYLAGGPSARTSGCRLPRRECARDLQHGRALRLGRMARTLPLTRLLLAAWVLSICYQAVT